jgi:hypothetical protein
MPVRFRGASVTLAALALRGQYPRLRGGAHTAVRNGVFTDVLAPLQTRVYVAPPPGAP